MDLEGKKIQSVAVLPFLNNSSFDQGGTVVQRIFASELEKADDISVCMEGDIRGIYRELRIFSYQLPDIEQRRILGSRLGADVLISGSVEEMDENSSGKYINPVLALGLRAYDAESGRTVWTTYYKREGRDYRTVMHFGLINTISGLTREMSGEILQEWFSGNRQEQDKE